MMMMTMEEGCSIEVGDEEGCRRVLVLVGFWSRLESDWIMVGFWLGVDRILVGVGWIVVGFWWGSGWVLVGS